METPHARESSGIYLQSAGEPGIMRYGLEISIAELPTGAIQRLRAVGRRLADFRGLGRSLAPHVAIGAELAIG